MTKGLRVTHFMRGILAVLIVPLSPADLRLCSKFVLTVRSERARSGAVLGTNRGTAHRHA